MSGIEESAIDEGEGANLARALLDVCKRRKVKPNPEALAWGNFAAVLFTIYGPRILAVLAKRKQPAARAQAELSTEPIIVGEMDATGAFKPQVAN